MLQNDNIFIVYQSYDKIDNIIGYVGCRRDPWLHDPFTTIPFNFRVAFAMVKNSIWQSKNAVFSQVVGILYDW